MKRSGFNVYPSIFKSSVLFLLFFTTILFYQESTYALLEARIHYNLQSVQSSATQSSVPRPSSLNGIGADVIVSPPLFPVSFGLRYELLGSQDSSSDFDHVEWKVSRLSGLISYRFIDTLVFGGFIGTVGLSENIKTIVKRNNPFQRDEGGTLSYSIGVEGGVKLLFYSMGLELGFSHLKDKGLDPHQTYQGIYTKIHVGMGF